MKRLSVVLLVVLLLGGVVVFTSADDDFYGPEQTPARPTAPWWWCDPGQQYPAPNSEFLAGSNYPCLQLFDVELFVYMELTHHFIAEIEVIGPGGTQYGYSSCFLYEQAYENTLAPTINMENMQAGGYVVITRLYWDQMGEGTDVWPDDFEIVYSDAWNFYVNYPW